MFNSDQMRPRKASSTSTVDIHCHSATLTLDNPQQSMIAVVADFGSNNLHIIRTAH